MSMWRDILRKIAGKRKGESEFVVDISRPPIPPPNRTEGKFPFWPWGADQSTAYLEYLRQYGAALEEARRQRT